MLKRKHRLTLKNNLVLKNACNTPLFTVRYQPNNLPHSRFGFVISKRVDKRAVIRNKIKRIFRSCIEETLENIKEGLDFLFILKSPTKDLSKAQLKDHIEKTLKKEKFFS